MWIYKDNLQQFSCRVNYKVAFSLVPFKEVLNVLDSKYWDTYLSSRGDLATQVKKVHKNTQIFI